jgi:hypothetical protein
VEADRRPLRSLDALSELLERRAAGESVAITLERDGRRQVVTARLARRPGLEPKAEAPPVVEESLPPPLESVVPAPRDPAVKPPQPPQEASPQDEVESLRHVLAELRGRLEVLERRLAELEERLAPDRPAR